MFPVFNICFNYHLTYVSKEILYLTHPIYTAHGTPFICVFSTASHSTLSQIYMNKHSIAYVLLSHFNTNLQFTKTTCRTKTISYASHHNTFNTHTHTRTHFLRHHFFHFLFLSFLWEHPLYKLNELFFFYDFHY